MVKSSLSKHNDDNLDLLTNGDSKRVVTDAISSKVSISLIEAEEV